MIVTNTLNKARLLNLLKELECNDFAVLREHVRQIIVSNRLPTDSHSI